MPSCHSCCGILSWLLLKYSNVQLSLHWTKEYALAVRQHIIATQWPCLIPHPVCLHRSMEIEEVICSIQTHSSFLAICVSHAVKLHKAMRQSMKKLSLLCISALNSKSHCDHSLHADLYLSVSHIPEVRGMLPALFLMRLSCIIVPLMSDNVGVAVNLNNKLIKECCLMMLRSLKGLRSIERGSVWWNSNRRGENNRWEEEGES